MMRIQDPPNTVELNERRKNIQSKMPEKSILVLKSAQPQPRNLDVHHPYHQENDFLYLTGFVYAHGILVITPTETYMFIQESDQHTKKWEGIDISIKNTLQTSGITNILALEQFSETIAPMLASAQIYFGHYEQDHDLFHQCLTLKAAQATRDLNVFEHIHHARPLIAQGRCIKSDYEINCIKKAIHVTEQALSHVAPIIPKAQHEHTLLAELNKAMITQDVYAMAYPPIIASGANSCILHYDRCNGPIAPHDLCLMDIGAQWSGYASDITRCFPASGQFSEAQRAIYTAVLNTQKAIIALIKPGISLHFLNEQARNMICQHLIDLKFIQGPVASALEQNLEKTYYMHGIGHLMGLDVHDVGFERMTPKEKILKPGMVLTVEPGIYIEPHDHIPKEFHHIGVRIEDDILVTETGHEICSIDIPKEIPDVEHMMQ